VPVLQVSAPAHNPQHSAIKLSRTDAPHHHTEIVILEHRFADSQRALCHDGFARRFIDFAS